MEMNASGKLIAYKSEGTILKVDLHGFGAFSDASTVDEIAMIPHKIFDLAEPYARRNGGVPLKRDGDATTISFNIEEGKKLKDMREGAISAVRSGLQMQEAIETMRQELEIERLAKERNLNTDILRARIGISTGEMRYEAYRTGERELLDINGRPMKIATRLEELADEGTVLVDEETYRLAQKRFEWEDLGEIEIKGGREKSVRAYRPLREVMPTFDLRNVKEAFFGRESEVARIKTYLKTGGDPIEIRGMMGIGKTSLAEQALPGRTLVKFSLLDRTTPLSLLRIYYETIFGKDLSPEKLAKLGFGEEYPYVALPLNRDVSGYDIPEESGVRERRVSDAYHKTRKLFDIVVFDDVQWADNKSLGLIASAADWERNILTARPEFEASFPTTKVELRPLGTDHSKQILREFLGDYFDSLDKRTVKRILGNTKGNPFHTKYLAISLRERLELGEDPKTALDNLPKEMESFIESMVSEYGSSIFRALRVGSHLRRKWLYRSDIESLLGENIDDDALQRLAKAGLIILDPKRPLTIEMSDEKILDVLYSRTPEDQRKEIHKLWGDFYQRMLITNLPEGQSARHRAFLLNTASQYALSSCPERAVPYLIDLGVIERKDGHTELSAEHLKLALEILRKQEKTPREVERETILELDQTLKQAGLYKERGVYQGPNLAKIEDEERSLRRHKYFALIGTAASILEAEPEHALEYYRKAMVLAEQEGDINRVIDVEYSMSVAYIITEDYENAEKMLVGSIQKSEDVGNIEGCFRSHNILGVVYQRQNQLDRAEIEFQKSWDYAKQSGSKLLMSTAKRNLANLEEIRRNPEKVLEYSLDCLKLSKQIGKVENEFEAISGISYGFIETGRPEEALPYLEEGIELIRRNPVFKDRPSARYIQEKHLEIVKERV